MSHRPLPAATAIAAFAIAASLLLGGCSFLPRVPILNDGDSSSDGIEDNPFLDHEVPDTFPSDIPLPDLDILFSLTVTENSWAIQYKGNDLASDYSSVVAQFEADGWEVMMNNESPDGSLGVFSKAPYQVQVTGVPDGGDEYDGPILNFTVVETE